MKFKTLLLGAVLVLSAWTVCLKRGPTNAEVAARKSAHEKTRQELTDALMAKFKPFPPNWGSIEVNEATIENLGRVSVSAIYKRLPTGLAEAEKDTTALVRFCLQWLMGRGIDPVKQQMTVSASAEVLWVGETGKKSTRRIGRSRYFGSRDEIEFLR